MADIAQAEFLSLRNGWAAERTSQRLLVLGEILWDVFDHSTRLGGAPLNFAAHAQRLGYNPLLISGVGADALGDEAVRSIEALGLETRFLQRAPHAQTGIARVELGPDDRTRFVISRPAAYDCVDLSTEDLRQVRDWAPDWFYFGTLFSQLPRGRALLQSLLEAAPSCTRFYDLNLRPGNDAVPLVKELLTAAHVVKLNEDELDAVRKFTGLPAQFEAFCREGARRFHWRAVCVTLGARGCALFRDGEYVEAGGFPVDVADPVGAGDAFSAAFVHGLISEWPLAKIAAFANRVGALVASRPGAIPDWTVKEAVEL